MTAKKVRKQPTPRVTLRQKEIVLGWIGAGVHDYVEFRRRLEEHDFPELSRRALSNLLSKYGHSPACETCGRPFLEINLYAD